MNDRARGRIEDAAIENAQIVEWRNKVDKRLATLEDYVLQMADLHEQGAKTVATHLNLIQSVQQKLSNLAKTVRHMTH